MRKGITIAVTSADRVRLDAIARDRNSPQKHVWRARIVLLTADGKGTNAITEAVGKDKTAVWRWQERFMHEGIEGLTRDKTLAYCTAADRDRRSGGRTDEPSAAPRGDPLERPGNGQGGWGSAGPRCGASGQGKGFSDIG